MANFMGCERYCCIFFSGYAVERRAALPGSEWVRANAVDTRGCEVILTGLHPGQVYQFRVLAANAVGWSNASLETYPHRIPYSEESASAPCFVQALRDTTIMEHEKVRLSVSFSTSMNPPVIHLITDLSADAPVISRISSQKKISMKRIDNQRTH